MVMRSLHCFHWPLYTLCGLRCTTVNYIYSYIYSYTYSYTYRVLLIEYMVRAVVALGILLASGLPQIPELQLDIEL